MSSGEIIQKYSKCSTNKLDLNSSQDIQDGEIPFLCEKDFLQNIPLNKHISSLHERKKPFNCSDCNTNFETKHKLNDHDHEHELNDHEHELNDHEHELNDHVAANHEGIVTLQCEQDSF